MVGVKVHEMCNSGRWIRCGTAWQGLKTTANPARDPARRFMPRSASVRSLAESIFRGRTAPYGAEILIEHKSGAESEEAMRGGYSRSREVSMVAYETSIDSPGASSLASFRGHGRRHATAGETAWGSERGSGRRLGSAKHGQGNSCHRESPVGPQIIAARGLRAGAEGTNILPFPPRDVRCDPPAVDLLQIRRNKSFAPVPLSYQVFSIRLERRGVGEETLGMSARQPDTS